MALAGRNAFLKAASVTATTSTGNAATRSTGVGGTGYVQVNSTARRHWEPTSTPTLYLNSTAVSSTNYNVNYVQGKFQWRTGDPVAGTYTADVEYLTVSNVGGGREWQLNVEQDMFEITEFGSSGWKEYQPNMAGGTVSVSRYWTDATFFDHLTLSNKFLVELGVNSASGDRFEAFAYMTGDQHQAAVDSLVSEGMSLTIDGAIYYSTA
jgi:hypothetical protein